MDPKRPTLPRALVVDRRTALKGLAALTAAPGLAAPGCATPGDGGDPQADDDTTPAPDPEPGVIDTLVFVMMENRTFDHYFGSLSLEQGRDDVDGLRPGMSNPDLAGEPVEPWPLDEMCLLDPHHSWSASHEQFNGGANDRFVTVHEEDYGPAEGPKVMGYYRESQLPVYYALARQGALCQKWFASVMGPTWPNRLFGHAAQSQGMTSNSFPDNEDGSFGFSARTIWDQLTDASVPWAYYYTDLPFLALFGTMSGNPNIRPVKEFYAAAAAGTLPRVMWIDPGFGLNDDHPPHHPGLGQVFVATIVSALAQSPHWERCLFVLTYDEHGGFFDHVPPPTIADDRAAEGFDQLGFRVPAFAIGPYVKQGHVSDTVREHSSFMKQVQRMHGLDPLTARNAATQDLQDLIDEDRLARGEPLPPPEVPFVEVPEEELDGLCDDLFAAGQPDALARAAQRGLLPGAEDLVTVRRRAARELFAAAESLGVGRLVPRKT